MEQKDQSREIKSRKKSSKGAAKKISVRISSTLKERTEEILFDANKKNYGRSIKFDDLFELLLGLLQKEHVESLQSKSMTNEDRKEVLRQKYIAIHGAISKDEFLGFMLTGEFQKFLLEQKIDL